MKTLRLSAILCVCAWMCPGVVVPAGTELQVRLKSKVSTGESKPNEPVEAVVISPVMIGGKVVVPLGATLVGKVKEVQLATKPDERAALDLTFSQLEAAGYKTKVITRLVGVDNARESVDEKGRILGILASETLSARMDQGIGKLAAKYAGLADVLGAAKGAVLKESEGQIAYAPGVEMTVRLTEPLNVTPPANAGPQLEPINDEADLATLVTSQPFQTTAEKPPKPSDVTNLMFVGTREQLEKAFQEAGWSSAAALSAQSKLETFRAIAELRGYKEAPVSILLLDGQPPEMVFQKQNNTFAQRHHLRIWARPTTFNDVPVWVCAATHDTGIDFSPENRTFIHKIDSQIDRERAKVVNDLLLTGKVRSLALVDRPAVPKKSENATGDALETDGAMAVLILK
jgi:hypothetical protein